MQKVIVTWEDLRSEIRLLFTHEGLGEDLAGRFAVFMDEEVHDPAVVSIWSQIESDRRRGDNEPLTVMDLDCGLEEVVACLVDWNNNPWNFPPRHAPERLNFDEVQRKVLNLSRRL
jgi:hypothetical protein